MNLSHALRVVVGTTVATLLAVACRASSSASAPGVSPTMGPYCSALESCCSAVETNSIAPCLVVAKAADEAACESALNGYREDGAYSCTFGEAAPVGLRLPSGASALASGYTVPLDYGVDCLEGDYFIASDYPGCSKTAYILCYLGTWDYEVCSASGPPAGYSLDPEAAAYDGGGYSTYDSGSGADDSSSGADDGGSGIDDSGSESADDDGGSSEDGG